MGVKLVALAGACGAGDLQRSFAGWFSCGAGTCGAQDDNGIIDLREGSAGWFARGGFVVGGIEDYAAVEAFAVAFGAEVGLVAESEVDDAALARGHGSEVERGSGLADFFGSDRRGHAEFLEADGALVLAVEGNLFVLAGGQVEDFEG